MRTTFSLAALSLAACLSLACSFYARGPKDYHKVTKQLLDTKEDDIKRCYKKVHKDDKGAKGTVVVHFYVEEKTGKITDTKALPESTAPDALKACVVEAIDGLVLNPPDERKGDATFSYEFKEQG